MLIDKENDPFFELIFLKYFSSYILDIRRAPQNHGIVAFIHVKDLFLEDRKPEGVREPCAFWFLLRHQ